MPACSFLPVIAADVVIPVSGSFPNNVFTVTARMRGECENQWREAMQTEFCKQLGIEAPIFAFTHCRDVVVEVSKAGGIGVLGLAGLAGGGSTSTTTTGTTTTGTN